MEAKEEWRAVPGYEGWYEVSDLGRVRSVDRIVDHEKDGSARRRTHILKPAPNTSGYPIVVLCKNSVNWTVPVHRLVSLAFLNDGSDGLEINHIDGNKRNNRLCNLQRVTRSENLKHAYRMGLMVPTPKLGEKNGASKLVASDVIAIRSSPTSRKKLATQYGVTVSNIDCILKGKSWKHLL